MEQPYFRCDGDAWRFCRAGYQGRQCISPAYGPAPCTNSIVAYMLGEVVSFRSIVQSLSYGLQPHLGDWYNVWLTFGNCLIIFFILWAMYKARVFVKI